MSLCASDLNNMWWASLTHLTLHCLLMYFSSSCSLKVNQEVFPKVDESELRNSLQSAASHCKTSEKHYSLGRLLSASGLTQSEAGACPWSDWCRGPSDWGETWSGTGGHETVKKKKNTQTHSHTQKSTNTAQINDLTGLSTWAGLPDLHPSLILHKRASSMEILRSF